MNIQEELHMKKAEFIKAVAEKLDTTQVEARATLDGVFEVFEDALVEGKKVPVGDLGKLEVRQRAARKGRNPQTGEEIDIPASKTVAFKVGKYGKDLVN